MKFPEDKFRSEIKFHIPCHMVPEIREFIAPYVKLDPNAKFNHENRYVVHSLYYDTTMLDFYFEKLDGLKIRKKLRIRTYNDFEKDAVGFFEIKRRYENYILKERSRYSFQQIQAIVRSPEKKWIEHHEMKNGKLALGRFLYNLMSRKLKPTLLVCYEREAFVDTFNPTIRLTIDHNIRSKPYPLLEDMFVKSMFDHHGGDNCILEFKYDGLMPRWMRLLMTKQKIQAQSVSKYCMGINSSLISQKKDMHYAANFS
ncbi:polyphosphate polymerase domain-containing protein [candidate division KSB1 bacterium]|nr:polyphosphate polymerase domain-containing protein [candidate division KSB1 bacterium]